MTELKIAGNTFRVEVAGKPTNPPLVLSHPLGTDLSMWAGQIPALTEHFRVIRYDTRGHGGSSLPGTPASIADLGTDAIGILDALEIERTDWLGLSMGGAIGLWLLANEPARIGRAVLANTAPKIGTPDAWNTRIAGVLAGAMDENAQATIERWFSPRFAEREPDRVDTIRSVLRSAPPQGYAACCAALRDMDLRESLRGIAHDVLVITGRHDAVIPTKDAAAMAASIGRAKLVALDARHMSHIEAEADFNAAVVTFLTAKAASVDGPSRKKPPTKTTSRSRGGAGRRSNAARRPLKKAPSRALVSGKSLASGKAIASGKALATAKASRTTRKAKKATTRRTAAKTGAARRSALGAQTKKAPAKAKRPTTAPSRRQTPVSARAPVKKIKARTTPARSATKKAAKKPVKKIASGRRRAPTKPRRPTGRRKR